MSADIITVQDQVNNLTSMGMQQKKTIDEVAERLEHLCVIVSRITKSALPHDGVDGFPCVSGEH